MYRRRCSDSASRLLLVYRGNGSTQPAGPCPASRPLFTPIGLTERPISTAPSAADSQVLDPCRFRAHRLDGCTACRLQVQPHVCLLRHQFAPDRQCPPFRTMTMLRSQITPRFWRAHVRSIARAAGRVPEVDERLTSLPRCPVLSLAGLDLTLIET